MCIHYEQTPVIKLKLLQEAPKDFILSSNIALIYISHLVKVEGIQENSQFAFFDNIYLCSSVVPRQPYFFQNIFTTGINIIVTGYQTTVYNL